MLTYYSLGLLIYAPLRYSVWALLLTFQKIGGSGKDEKRLSAPVSRKVDVSAIASDKKEFETRNFTGNRWTMNRVFMFTTYIHIYV